MGYYVSPGASVPSLRGKRPIGWGLKSLGIIKHLDYGDISQYEGQIGFRNLGHNKEVGLW